MSTRLTVLLAATIAVISPLAAAQTPQSATARQQDDTVSLNFANADIQAVIRAIGEISGRNFLIDPRVRGTLNIVTNRPVPRSLTYSILLSALRLQGYTAVESQGVTKILPESDAKLHAVPVGKNRARPVSGDRIVTEVFQIRHESAAQLVQVIRPLVTPNNTVSVYPGNNSLVITDYAENVGRIARIIESIDVPPGDAQIIPVRHASAVDLAGMLNRFFAEGSEGQAGAAAADRTQRVTIIPDARSNSLLVRSENRSRLQAVRSMAAQLDREGASGNIRLVYLKNAQAVQVAQTLRAILSGDVSAAAPGGTNPGAPTGSAAAPASTPNAGGSPTPSGAGFIQADPASNALIISAPDAIYNNLRGVIDQLDRRRAQVFVEALITELTASQAEEIGIQWQASPPSQGTTVFGGTNFGTGGQNILQVAQNPAGAASGLNLVIGAGQVSVLGKNILNLSVLARFLETHAKANTLSTPNLVTLDNEEAKIVVGQNLPFVTGQFTNTGGGTTPNNPFQTIERRDVGLTLRIRPQISEGGSVKLNIFQEVSSVFERNAATGPVTNKRSIESTVLVDDGHIIAIGGLLQDEYASGEEKVPLLGDVPLVGSLFRYDTRRRNKTNLVVFLRPVILRDAKSYDGFTEDRYDEIIGKQQTLDAPKKLMPGEDAPPQLPPRSPADQSAPPALVPDSQKAPGTP